MMIAISAISKDAFGVVFGVFKSEVFKCSDTANAWGSEPSGRGAGGGCTAGVAASRLVLSSPEVEEPDSLDPRAR